MENTENIETSLRDLFRVLFRHKTVFALFFILIMPSVYIGQELKSPISTAKVIMQIKGVKLSEVDYYKGLAIGSPEYIANTHSILINTPVIIDRVVKALKLNERSLDYGEMSVASRLRKIFINYSIKNYELLLKNKTAEQRREILYDRAVVNLNEKIISGSIFETDLFFIAVKDYIPGVAKIIANSLSRSFVIFDLQQQIAELTLKYGDKHSTVVLLKDHIENMYKSLDGRPLPFIEAMGPASVKIIQQASGVTLEKRTNKKTGLILAFLISFFGGIGSAFMLDYLSQTINSQKDVKKYLRIPFLGSIPKVKSNSKEKSNKLYEKISNRLDLLRKEKNCKSILFTAVEASKDTANIITNVGFCLARNNKNYKILIIDANLNEYLVSKVLNIENTKGLANVLEGKIRFEDAVQNVDINVDMLSAGKPDIDPVTLLRSSMMKDVIHKAQEIYDVIFISIADLTYSNDAVILSSFVDGLILVVNEGKVRHQIVQMAIAPFEKKKTHFIGAILNNYKMVIPKVIYKRI